MNHLAPCDVILIVEDDHKSLQLLEMILKPFHVKIVGVNDGEQAIHYCINHPEVCLILMDLKLPTLDGYETTAQIKNINPTIPIIAQTAYAMAGDREKAIEAGCDEYITKPITTSHLLDMIKTFLPNNDRNHENLT